MAAKGTGLLFESCGGKTDDLAVFVRLSVDMCMGSDFGSDSELVAPDG